MNKIIYLETDEEITSVVDKLRKIKTRDIVLVAPKRCTLVQSIVNLKLLKRQAKLLSKKIVLVTPDPVGQNLATKTGIPTKKEIEGEEIPPEEIKPKVEKPKIEKLKKPKEEEIVLPKIEKIKRESISDIVAKMETEAKEAKPEEIKPTPSKVEGPKEIKPKVPPRVVLLPSFNVKMFLVFLGGIIFVCAIVGLVILPSATIAIVPKTEPLLKDLEVTVTKDKEITDFESGIIPGKIVSVEIESAYKTFRSSGQKEVKEKARGKVIVYNSYSSESQTLKAGSRLRSSSGLMYLTLAGIEIPGAKVEGGITIPGSREVEIVSEEAGQEYNVGSTKFTIPSLSSEMQKAIWAENKERISGGKSEKIKVVSSKDIQDAQASLVAELTERAKKELQAKISKGEKFIEESLNKEVQVVDTNAQEGSEVGEFKMKIKLRMETLVFKEKNIQTLVEEMFEKIIPKEKYILDQTDEGISYEVAGFDPSTGNLRLVVHVQKTVAWKLDKKKIREALPGKDAEEAKEYLVKNPQIKEVEVSFWPIWVKSVPYIEKKIKLKEVFPE